MKESKQLHLVPGSLVFAVFRDKPNASDYDISIAILDYMRGKNQYTAKDVLAALPAAIDEIRAHRGR